MSGGSRGRKEAAMDERDVNRGRRVVPVALLAIALSAAACAAVSARAWLTPRTAAAVEPAKVRTPGEEVRDDPPPLPADVTLTTLNASGFSPSELAHEAGRFHVVVRNKSGETNLDLRLDGEESSRWTERHALGEVQGWTAEVELAAGTYTITEARHPEWVCRLSVR